jgi:hypothetical protein
MGLYTIKRQRSAGEIVMKEILADNYRQAREKEQKRAELARKNITLPRLEWLERQKARELKEPRL